MFDFYISLCHYESNVRCFNLFAGVDMVSQGCKYSGKKEDFCRPIKDNKDFKDFTNFGRISEKEKAEARKNMKIFTGLMGEICFCNTDLCNREFTEISTLCLKFKTLDLLWECVWSMLK